MLPTQPGLLFQGDDATNGGDGTMFGDGLRCASNNVIRLEVINADGGGSGDWSSDGSGWSADTYFGYGASDGSSTGFSFDNGCTVLDGSVMC